MRIPSLDGIRAVSIILVLLAHVAGTSHGPDASWLSVTGDIGNLGVRVFFVISGFLMTILLELEFELTGRISLAAFLRRRAFRILPAFGMYVAAIAALGAAGVLTLQPRDLVMSATFTMNYDVQRSWYVGHLWSLSVEAQFYVMWALTRVIVGRSRMVWAAVAALAAGPVCRVAIHVFAPEWRWSIGEAFPTIVDALATGGLLAMLQRPLASSPAYVRLLRSAPIALAPLAVIALNAVMPHVAFSYPVGQTVMNVLIALTIHRVVLFPDSGAGRFLNGRGMVGLGAVSYSLYLWQQPFLNRTSQASLAEFPLNVLFAFGAALLSYHFVERPVSRVRRRMHEKGIPPAMEPKSSWPRTHAAIS
jgi:peptidoglycan/LPS O-acetylase OafA/YrhL